MCVTRSQDFFSQRTGGAGVNDIVGKKKGKKKKCKYDKSTNVILLKKKKRSCLNLFIIIFYFSSTIAGSNIQIFRLFFFNFLIFFMASKSLKFAHTKCSPFEYTPVRKVLAERKVP